MSEYRDNPDVLERRVSELRDENQELRRRLAAAKKAPATQPSGSRRWALAGAAIVVVGGVGIFAATRSESPAPSASAPPAVPAPPAPKHHPPKPPPVSEPPPATTSTAAPLFAQAVTWTFSGTLSKMVGGSYEGVDLSECEILVRSLPHADGTVTIPDFGVHCVADHRHVYLFDFDPTHRTGSAVIKKQSWTDGPSDGSTGLELVAKFSNSPTASDGTTTADVTLDTRAGTATVKISRPSGSSELQFTDVQPGRDLRKVAIERATEGR